MLIISGKTFLVSAWRCGSQIKRQVVNHGTSVFLVRSYLASACESLLTCELVKDAHTHVLRSTQPIDGTWDNLIDYGMAAPICERLWLWERVLPWNDAHKYLEIQVLVTHKSSDMSHVVFSSKLTHSSACIHSVCSQAEGETNYYIVQYKRASLTDM